MDTKNIISNAMFGLLQRKPFEEITVQLILDEAKVSRATFYRHFRDKYELMNWGYQSYADKIIAKYEGENWQVILQQLYQFYYDHHKFLEHAFNVTGCNSFREGLYIHAYNFYKNEYLKKTNATKLTSKERLTLDFFCGGLCHSIKHWVNTGRRESVQEITAWTYEQIPKMFRKYL